MALESNVLDKATISFPWSLTLGQLRLLTDHVAETVKGSIHYDLSYAIRAGYETGVVGFRREDNIDFDGKVTLPNPPYLFDRFNFIYKHKDPAKIYGMQFQAKPGKPNSNYNPDVVQLWQDVRTAIENFFDDNPETNRHD
ncbi:hypothetical protein A3K62_01300 [Candidatus Pacearchaeota archaeon RBG_16_35_8]|nr:MAG: hypothetical protein A3K62_01300 [Candidatus Pacearchaeota archaeon RBG_16_35_8]